ncbi:unnamed protein product [Moneuplotes crassus]|uniref:Uncharacterized protein n=1 Tax=Euplotes crassus TaxID=5936 RepID=A0AAD1UML8_EUPCR|nr:unnamed protein product [Moneuplotes crassus]
MSNPRPHPKIPSSKSRNIFINLNSTFSNTALTQVSSMKSKVKFLKTRENPALPSDKKSPSCRKEEKDLTLVLRSFKLGNYTLGNAPKVHESFQFSDSCSRKAYSKYHKQTSKSPYINETAHENKLFSNVGVKQSLSVTKLTRSKKLIKKKKNASKSKFPKLSVMRRNFLDMRDYSGYKGSIKITKTLQ